MQKKNKNPVSDDEHVDRNNNDTSFATYTSYQRNCQNEEVEFSEKMKPYDGIICDLFYIPFH